MAPFQSFRIFSFKLSLRIDPKESLNVLVCLGMGVFKIRIFERQVKVSLVSLPVSWVPGLVSLDLFITAAGRHVGRPADQQVSVCQTQSE